MVNAPGSIDGKLLPIPSTPDAKSRLLDAEEVVQFPDIVKN
jgi:hypothetical protein